MAVHLRVSLTTDGEVVLRLTVDDGHDDSDASIRLEPEEAEQVGEILSKAGERAREIRGLIAEVNAIGLDDPIG